MNNHHIQKHILKVLTQQKWARFRDMRPSNIDSNLYNYHLKLLLKNKLIEKVADKGYRLSPAGLRYVDRVNLEKFEPTIQPKTLTKLVLTNKRGEVLMWPKYRQPFIGSWSLPSGKIHYDDTSLGDAARRELDYVTDETVSLQHAGVVEIRALILGELITHTIEHLFTRTIDSEVFKHPRVAWQPLDNIHQLGCSPGTTEAIEAVSNNSSFFYEKHDIDW